MTLLQQTKLANNLLFSLQDVSVSVPGKMLLQPLTASFEAGKIIGLIGHNGSGKSTLLKVLARLQEPSAGSVSFEGKDLKSWGGREFARRLGYLPQYTPSASGMAVKELVALGRYPWHGALGQFSADDHAKVEEAIELTHIGGLADRLVDTLSGGERQRVWLAMLVAQDTECLLLDEPISALDMAHQLEVLSLVRALSHRKGVGIIVVLHDVNMATRFCDEIVALHTGRIIERGTPEEIMTEDALERIYGLRMNIVTHPGSGLPVALPA